MASLAIGTVRTFVLYASRTVPGAYVGHGVLWNAGIALALSLALLPATLVAGRVLFRGRFASASLASLAGMLGAAVPFWLLNTAGEYRQPATLVSGLWSEAGTWAAGVAVIVVAWWVALRGRSESVVLRRCVGSVAILLASALGLSGYATLSHGKALPLDMGPTAKSRSPILIVLVDTLRADHLSVYGYDKPTSPAVDNFARDGTVYDLAFAHAPWTRPSCGSLLTSRYPPEIGLRGNQSALPAAVPILPQFLEREGYATAGIISNLQVSGQYGFDKGWQSYDLGSIYMAWVGVKRPLGRLRLIRRAEVYPRYNAQELTDRTIDWIHSQQGSSAPIFMYLHYSDPHAPYRPPADQDRWREFASGPALNIQTPRIAHPLNREPLSPAERAAMVARYDAEIAYFDAHFARLVAFLKERGLYDDALIIFTADHGEEFFEHEAWGHGHCLYNEVLRVPLIIKFPKGTTKPGERNKSLVGLIDIVPTVRDVIGSSWPDSSFRGRSLVGPDASASAERRVLYADNASPSLRGAMWGDEKLIQRLTERGEVEEELLFSLSADFAERHMDGLSPLTQPKRLGEIRRFTAALYDGALPAVNVRVDEDTREELRALGYVAD